MKKNRLYFLAVGCILFAVGIYGILSSDAFGAQILLFVGVAVLCIPASIPLAHWRDALTVNSAVTHEPIPHESIFLARLFLSMSWVARNCGILALEEFITDKKYDNSLYHMGKTMIIDGMDPDFIKETLGNVIDLVQERAAVKIGYLTQIAKEFCFIGVFAGFAGGTAYGIRWANGAEISTLSLGIFLTLTAIFFMLSTLCGLLLPGKIKSDANHGGQIQKQMIRGLISIQEGDSYSAVLHTQYTFLAEEEKNMLYEEPLFAEVRELNRSGNFDNTVADIRHSMRDFGYN